MGQQEKQPVQNDLRKTQSFTQVSSPCPMYQGKTTSLTSFLKHTLELLSFYF